MPTTTTNNKKLKNTHQILSLVLKEIRSLREDFSLFLSQEDLNEYAHPGRIKNSYLKAIKKYPRKV